MPWVDLLVLAVTLAVVTAAAALPAWRARGLNLVVAITTGNRTLRTLERFTAWSPRLVAAAEALGDRRR